MVMLILSANLNNIPLLAVRTGHRIGTVVKPIINSNNLHIDGFYCTQPPGNQLFLLDMHIREFSKTGIIINDPADLSEKEDLLRLAPVIDAQFSILGMQVVSGHKKLGKVTDYATDKDSLFIQKLYVRPPIWAAISVQQLVISRTAITEITKTQIIVSGPEQKAPLGRVGKASKTFATD
jgi:uncharacterized protein YrrD